MQSARSRLSPARRAVLGFGLLSGLGALTACSLRFDLPPEVPAPSAADSVRNELARVLNSTQGTGAQTAVLSELRTAVGPEWAPPPELVTPTATHSPSVYSYPDGLAASAQLVLDQLPTLVQAKSAAFTGRQLAALVDIAVGCTLELRAVDTVRAAELSPRLADPAAQASAAPSAAPPIGGDGQDDDERRADSGDADSVPAPSPVEEFVRACYQASYGYERLAVFHDAGSSYGAFARDRITELDQAATGGNEILRVYTADSVGNEPAWTITPEPYDQASALLTARALEDLVAGATLGLFTQMSADYLGVENLWNSALARAQAGESQTLRFAISDLATQSPTAAAGKGA